MKLTRFLVIASVLTARTCLTEIVLSPRSDEINLTKDLVNIVTSCYADRLRTVGLAGNLSDALSRTLSTEYSIPVALTDNAGNDIGDFRQLMSENFRSKLHVFVIAASNSQQLDILINMKLRPSVLWNSRASFIIVDRSSGCLNVVDYLLVAWTYNAINAKVLCYENGKTRTIHNYNPYTGQAPVPWQRHNVTRGIIDHPFTVFYQNYRVGKSMCANLDFEKTNNLGGYEINVYSFDFKGRTHLLRQHDMTSGLLLVSGALRIQEIAWRTLNGTEKVFAIKKIADTQDIWRKCHVTNFLYKLNELSTYSYLSLDSELLTLFRGYKSIQNEIFYIIDMYSWIGIAVIYLITFMFFTIVLNQAVVPAFLNIVRLTSGMDMRNLLDDSASRIYVSSLLLFLITIQVIIQCDLSHQLTASVPLKDIDTLEDVETFGYKVCIGYERFYCYSCMSPYIRRNYVNASVLECYDRIKDHKASAILVTQPQGAVLARELNLHIGKEIGQTMRLAFVKRPDWAVEVAFDRIIATLVESDTVSPWDLKIRASELNDYNRFNTPETSANYKPLELADITFAFIFLGIGLACATICFIIELALRYKSMCSIAVKGRHGLPFLRPGLRPD